MSEKIFHSPNIDVPSTQKELAESYGITQQTMNNYMRMTNMIPELEDLVDTGIVTKDTALAILMWCKGASEYVRLRGYKQGEVGKNHFQTCPNGTSEKSTLDKIAKELNMSKRNLQRALRIERNLTDSMKELLDTGEINKTLPVKYHQKHNQNKVANIKRTC